MRLSVYVQCISCIALLLFPTAHELVKSSFRNSVLTMYAIGFAFFVAHHTGDYSLQSLLVAHCFVDILLLSAFSLLALRPILRESRRHWVLLAGGVPFGIWTFVQAQTRKSECFDSAHFEIVNIDSHTFQLYKGFWAVSVVVWAVSLPIITLPCFPKACSKLEPGVSRLATISWFLATVSTIAVSESILKTYSFSGNPNAPTWTFGQVFSVVMLFFIVWDIALYPFGSSTESEGSRIRHWWNQTSSWKFRKLLPGSSL